MSARVWTAKVDWRLGKVDVQPYWPLALPAWVLPALVGEAVVEWMGGYLIGIIMGVSVSLIKSYYDFYLIMAEYIPPLQPKRTFWQILFR